MVLHFVQVDDGRDRLLLEEENSLPTALRSSSRSNRHSSSRRLTAAVPGYPASRHARTSSPSWLTNSCCSAAEAERSSKSCASFPTTPAIPPLTSLAEARKRIEGLRPDTSLDLPPGSNW
jgi:hypothetical protein